ncbi:bifunctional arginine demethylase and lysyl-hydroxylase JMJD6-like [Mya arenaria]|uniref:bifunctional arginine demethylase and lysyl-hydroxylase JMJD6-like n=1 Tax=Mya arenaria TaxID=6604 RepID=UPI0022DEBB50|nr:bifunctional arginine demethylase and lysyl-hydroxylase JMJD6-like [Mya arenaria]XP_052820968.1 bifunctional arginine demethylase and lysyl-hydroxylase JMJD6-like [Mya arenaria]XP_052820969.1 bifunctional arginine demethylase and lysyl-hydroxylase JMJD6-like [Mya arenaria]XP_052820970.1 bifunctional arginine demethylase and lysyl-hydroxylase JMJD6-like [Mya arenaria]XP_052820971.1 bifunctional arginine demethylase and lysyl-hydroxylase JMJD6-like [Mya arenaria]XP_052820972.1 bifunctional ar
MKRGWLKDGRMPGKPTNPHKLRSHLRELAYLQSRELVTPCRLLLVLIVSICLVLLIAYSVDYKEYIIDDTDEVNMTKRPYVQDHQCLKQTREEMLSHYGYSPSFQKVEKRSSLSLEEFWDLYDAKWPVIVQDIVPDWEAYKTWSKEFFLKNYRHHRIMLKAVEGVLEEGVAFVRSIEEFLSLLDQCGDMRHWSYIEDEMFLLQRPELRSHIGNNYLLDENFFNLFPPQIRPWDSMLLWGTKYSRSTLHMDPYNWTAVSAVIWGRKRWKLFPPGQDTYLYISPKQRCGFPLDCRKYNSKVDSFDVDYMWYPKFQKAEYIEVEQNSGEVLVIPSGWFHQAFNEEETLSISTQLMNRNNYLVILEEIIKGKNLNRKQLPPHFNTLLPPDQVKLFMSLIPKKILKQGKEITDFVLESVNMSSTQDLDNSALEEA